MAGVKMDNNEPVYDEIKSNIRMIFGFSNNQKNIFVQIEVCVQNVRFSNIVENTG